MRFSVIPLRSPVMVVDDDDKGGDVDDDDEYDEEALPDDDDALPDDDDDDALPSAPLSKAVMVEVWRGSGSGLGCTTQATPPTSSMP